MSKRPRTSINRTSVAAALPLLGAAASASLAVGLFWSRAEAVPQRVDFQKQIRPLLEKYCFECHDNTRRKGGFSLEGYADVAAVHEQRDTWAELLRKLRTREMPPEGKPQPTEKERERLIGWVDAELFPVDCDNPDPGRVTIRRLNRTEYNNTIRDLVGVDIRPAQDFPSDDTGHGFDNIGDVLTLSPLLLEKYLAAAERVMDAVFTNAQAKARIFALPSPAANTNAWVAHLMGNFARRAFRRPLSPAETERLAGFVNSRLRNGESLETALKLGFEAVLVSPAFLFRAESQPHPNEAAERVPFDEFALASRLSYFLWSSMPDDQLFALAEKGRLRHELPKQVKRMLEDPKSRALVENFAGQWLQTRNLETMAPDTNSFPAFDEDLRHAMAKETELFFAHILREDRSVMEFLTADYTFVNDKLARHYRLKQQVAGGGFQKVSLKGTGRGGVLTHASILTLTSNPTRTSPVKRGKWVLENLLAQPPPPPPPDVPALNDGQAAAAAASLRERMEKHRQDPLCASCHAQMDPIGFSLENFDAVGAWRETDGPFPVNASGRMPSGDRFSGASGLRSLILRKHQEQFLQCLAEKMLTYALGRGLEYYDRCALEKIVAETRRRDGRFSALVQAVVDSVPFQMRRGEGDPPAMSPR